MRLLLALAVAAGVQAATINTTLTITNAALSIGVTTTLAGPCTLSGIGSCTFSATVNTSASGFSGPFTITITSGGSLTGTFNLPTTVLAGSGSGSATITGGTGTYVNASGSFPNLTGSATSSGTGFTVSLSGAGTIVTGGPPTPTISAVLDAGSYTASVALGSIFVVKGANMSATGLSQTTFPLPQSFNGVSITFVPAAGGSGTNAYIIYLYNQSGVNQLAAVVPSTLTPGNFNVTVTNNGVTSPPFSVTVVARKPEIITQDATGNGLAVVQNFISASQLDVNRFTTGSVNGVTISPAHLGQTLVLWVDGTGAVPGGTDNTASPGYDFTKNGVTVQVILGGGVKTITPLYAGRAPGLTGVEQYNFTLTGDSPTGCTVQIQVSVNGTMSHGSDFIAIAPSGSDTCVQPGFTSQQLRDFDNGKTITTGLFNMTQFAENLPTIGNIKIDQASGVFTKYTGFELAAIPPNVTASPSALIGTCYVPQPVTGTGSGLGIGGINLDAGKVTLTGPSGSNITNLAFTETNNTYSLNIGSEGGSLPGFPSGNTLVAGAYTVNGAGGTDVGAFNASITLGSPLTITGGLPATINRGSGFSLAWTGGNPTDFVEVIGFSSSGTGASAVTTTFICYTTAGQKGITVPGGITSQLPASTNGFLEVASGPNPAPFSAPLTAGGSIDAGFFFALIGSGAQVAYQ